jgi:hypothetical protein
MLDDAYLGDAAALTASRKRCHAVGAELVAAFREQQPSQGRGSGDRDSGERVVWQRRLGRLLLGDSSGAGLVTLSMIGVAFGARSAPSADYLLREES